MKLKSFFIILVLFLPFQCFAWAGNIYKDFCKQNISMSSKACINTDENWNDILQKDWKIYEDYVRIYDFLYSNDWESFSFTAKNKDWDYVLMKDWKQLVPEKMNIFTLMSDLQYIWDSHTIAYKLQNIDEDSFELWYNIYNNETKKGFYNCNRIDIYYWDSEQNFSYTCQKNMKNTLYINKWNNILTYDNPWEFSYSPDGKSYAFTKIKDDWSEYLIVNWFEIKNGNKENCNWGNCSKSIYTFVFSDDSKYLAYEKKYLWEREVFINGVLIDWVRLYSNGDFFKYNKEKYIQEINKLKENANNDQLTKKIDRVIRVTSDEKLEDLRSKLLKIDLSDSKYSKSKYILEYLWVQIENKLLKLKK